MSSTFHSSPGNQPPRTIIIREQGGPGCLVQGLWFIFVGWWLGGLAVTLAWFLNVTILGLPLGMLILNNIPQVLALQTPQQQIRSAIRTDGTMVVTQGSVPQHNFLLRTVFFLLIGWWWSGVWLGLAYILCATVILIPVGLEMFRLTPAMTTLRRY